MPLPKAKRGQSKQQYLTDFMSNDKMVLEFPDPNQRYAVAISKWKETKMNKRG